MRIQEILDHKGKSVETVGEDQTVAEAVRILCKRRIGALVVLDAKGAVCGIVTERDILRDCGRVLDTIENTAQVTAEESTNLVKDIMTTDLVIGVPDDRIDYVMKIMTKNNSVVFICYSFLLIRVCL